MVASYVLAGLAVLATTLYYAKKYFSGGVCYSKKRLTGEKLDEIFSDASKFSIG